MTLVRFNPRNEFDFPAIPKRFSDMIDEFFNESLSQTGNKGTFLPGIDIIENDSHYMVNVNLPGMNKEDIKIDLDDRVLSISGERKQEIKDENAKYHLVETRYGSFSRSFTLPDNINSESINATYENGVLKLAIEKAEKKVSKQIEVR